MEGLFKPRIKPIFIVRVPPIFNQDAVTLLSNDVTEKLKNDYHVLVVRDRMSADNNIRFEVFNPDSFKEIEFEKLKKRLLILAEDKLKYL